jgi:hypothetical protein
MSETPGPAMTIDRLRRLKGDERVSKGDFVADNRQGFELWDGPRGFRADAFVKQIYRQLKPGLSNAVKLPKPASK